MDRRLMSTVWYPARPEDVDEVLAGADPITPGSLAEGRATARGLATVEHLLFASDTADPVRRCSYASAAATLAAGAAREVAGDWTGAGGGEPYTATLAAGIDGDPQASLAALVNELAHALQTVDDQGLRGIALAGAPDDVPEAQRDGPAGHRVADLRALLDTVRLVVEGPSGDDGLGGLVASRSTETGERLDEALGAAVTTVGALPDSIAATLEAPDDLAAAADDAAELKVVLSTEVASVLGITIGFSDADGDS
jgi:predicted lipoprotein